MEIHPDQPSAICPFCQSNQSQQQWQSVDQEGNPDTVLSCCRCGTHFLHPPPTPERLERAYASHYYGGNDAAKFNSTIERLRAGFAQNRARALTAGLPPLARILDVGCSEGRLLRMMGAVGTFELHGVELPGKAAERAATSGQLQLHLGTLESCQLPDGHFDLITLVHVFEHLPNPVSALEKLNRLLKPGGRLFISYPNCTSWQAIIFKGNWFHLDPPRHLTLVPPQALITRLENQGYRCLQYSHLSWEQNLYGWMQSVLNLFPTKRNLLYEWMKRNRAYIQNHRPMMALHFILALTILPLSCIVDLLAACVRKGATVEIIFEKQTSLSK